MFAVAYIFFQFFEKPLTSIPFVKPRHILLAAIREFPRMKKYVDKPCAIKGKGRTYFNAVKPKISKENSRERQPNDWNYRDRYLIRFALSGPTN